MPSLSPGGALTSDQMLTLLSSAGVPRNAGSLGEWLARAKAESSLRPAVVNSIGATGLFQILQPLHVKTHPTWTVAWLQNPANNVAAARELSNGWTNTAPWAASRLGTTARLPASVAEASAFLSRGGASVENASWLDDLLGNLSGAASGVTSGASDTAGALTAFAETLTKLTNPATWLRFAYGITGIALVVGAAVVLARPVLAPAAKVASKAL